MKLNLEVETKYSAEKISLTEFKAFCASKNPKNMTTPYGPDHFYKNLEIPDSFYRHRVGSDFNQLTFKKKLNDKNNFIRVEHNIDLKKNTKVETIAAYCSELGYKSTSSIFKTCTIYYYDKYSLVYYVCYDKDMKELGRFIEIEMDEDYAWGNEGEAWLELTQIEQECKALGLSAQARIKRSLYELFVK
jgi:predicted adenylyl cyclase CyaB